MSYVIQPEEHELREARSIITGAIEAARNHQRLESDFRVMLGWTEDEFVKEHMMGVIGMTWSGELVKFDFNSTVSDWKRSLRVQAAHEYGHLYFYQSLDEEPRFNWQDVLIEAHGQMFARKVFPDEPAPWRDRVEEEAVAEHWPVVKEELSDEVDWDARPIFYGSEEYPNWMGYSLACLIGDRLMDDHLLEDFPDLKKSDVIDAGDELFL